MIEFPRTLRWRAGLADVYENIIRAALQKKDWLTANIALADLAASSSQDKAFMFAITYARYM